MSIETYPCIYRLACEGLALLVRPGENGHTILPRIAPESDGMMVGDHAFCAIDTEAKTMRFVQIRRPETFA